MYSSPNIIMDKMSGACSTHARNDNYILYRNQGIRPLCRPLCKFDDTIKMDLKQDVSGLTRFNLLKIRSRWVLINTEIIIIMYI